MIKLTFKYEKTYNFIVDKAKYVYNDDLKIIPFPIEKIK